ncbi:MAG: PEGA domain-containing protein [Bacteroidota bacterium]
MAESLKAGQAGLLRNGLIIFFLSLSTANAQTGRLTVESTPSGAAVYVDSMLVGTTPLLQHEVYEGRHELKLFYPSATSWMAISKKETIDLSSGQEVRYAYELGTVLTLNSKPAGASVLYQSRELGMTPLLYRTPRALSGTLLVKKDGYEPAAISVSPEYTAPLMVELRPYSADMADRLPDVLPPEYHNGSSPRWMTYATASSMVLSGVLSAVWKNQANRDFDQYLVTKDPALFASTQRLDRRSGIAITVSHLSFALLAYLLVSD